jgi:WD40 repeat protein
MPRSVPACITTLMTLFVVSACTAEALAAQASSQSPNISTDANLDKLWRDLLATDAEAAFKSMLRLSQTPKETVGFLKDSVPPAPPVLNERVQKLIHQLGSEHFPDRDAARRELEKLDLQALPALRKAAANKTDLEVSRRLDQMISRLEGPPVAAALRLCRAVELAEWMGTADAKELLQHWADGAGDARLTQEAKRAVKRLANRQQQKPLPSWPRLDAAGDPLPKGAVMRIGSSRWRASGPFHHVRFTPDGKHLVSVGLQDGITITSVRDGKVLNRLVTYAGMGGVAISPDGNRLAGTGIDARGKGILKTWTLPDCKETGHWYRHGLVLGFAPKRDAVFIERQDGIEEFDLAQGREAAFHPFPKDWKLSTLCIQGETALTAAGGDLEENARFFVFDLSKAAKVHVLDSSIRFPTGTAIAPNGKILACGVADPGNSGVLLYDLTTRKFLRRLSVGASSFGFDGLTFSAVQDAHTLVVWDVENDRLRWQQKTRATHAVFSPDSRLLACGGPRTPLWDAGTGTIINGGPDAVVSNETAFDGNGTTILTTQEDGPRLYALPSGKELRQFTHAGTERARLSPNGRYVAAASKTGGLRVWEAADGRERFELPRIRVGDSWQCDFTPDGNMVAWEPAFEPNLWGAKDELVIEEGGAARQIARRLEAHGSSLLRFDRENKKRCRCGERSSCASST